MDPNCCHLVAGKLCDCVLNTGKQWQPARLAFGKKRCADGYAAVEDAVVLLFADDSELARGGD